VHVPLITNTGLVDGFPMSSEGMPLYFPFPGLFDQYMETSLTIAVDISDLSPGTHTVEVDILTTPADESTFVTSHSIDFMVLVDEKQLAPAYDLDPTLPLVRGSCEDVCLCACMCARACVHVSASILACVSVYVYRVASVPYPPSRQSATFNSLPLKVRGA